MLTSACVDAFRPQATDNDGRIYSQSNPWDQDFSGHNSNADHFGGNQFDGADDNQFDGGLGGQLVEVKEHKKLKIGDDYEEPLTLDEQTRVDEVARDQKARLQRVVEKEANEESDKRANRDKAKKELKQWYDNKERDRVAKSKQNKEEEWAFLQQREDHKRSLNKWEKIIDNCEMNANKYLGAKDVSRMRQSMLARKSDMRSQTHDEDD